MKPGIYCLCSSLANTKIFQDACLFEDDIFLNPHMLKSYYDRTFKCIMTPIESQINNWYQKNCEYKKINSNKFALEHLEGHIQNCIVNLDKKFLTYSKTYNETKTLQSRHYLNILNIKNNRYYILDSCVPSTPRSTYTAWMEIENEAIENAVILLIEKIKIDKDFINENRLNYIYSSVESRINDYKMEDSYIRFYNEIEQIHFKDYYEISVSLAIGGLDASLMLFKKNLENYEIRFREQINYLDLMIKKLFSLRIFIFKSFLTKNKKCIKEFQKYISEIRTMEMELLKSF